MKIDVDMLWIVIAGPGLVKRVSEMVSGYIYTICVPRPVFQVSR